VDSSEDHVRVIEETKQRIIRLTLAAKELEHLIEESRGPERSHHESTLRAIRQVAWDQEVELKKLETPKATVA